MAFYNINPQLISGAKAAGKGLLKNIFNTGLNSNPLVGIPLIKQVTGIPASTTGNLPKTSTPSPTPTTKPTPETYSQQFVNPGLSPSPTPIGVKAASSTTNIKPTPNTIAPKYQAPMNLTPSAAQNQAALAGIGTTPPSTTQNVSTGQFGASGGTPGGAQTAQNNQMSPGGLYGGLIAALAGRGLQDSQGVQSARQALLDSQMNEAQQLGLNASNPIPLEFQQGRAQVLQNQYGQQQQALSNALQSATTTQGQQIGALQGAAGLAQPVSQFGMLTNPITGQPLNTGVFQSAVQQAVQLVQNGTPANDPSVQQLLSPFGFVGPLAFNQAQQAISGGGWNPAAQSAAAGQNISAATDFQQQAITLDTGLKNMRTVAPLVVQAAGQVGINPTDSTMYNAPINTYISQIRNSGGFANFQAMMNDIQRYSSQIISSGADLTPTGVTAATALMSPQNLSIAQIQSYLNTLDQLGTNQLAILQQQARAAGGSSAGYYGDPARVNSGYTAPQSSAYGGNITSPSGQFAAGVGLSTLGQLENIGTQVLSFLSGLFL